MKKIFTLIAAAMVAVAANAQFKWVAGDYSTENLAVEAYEKTLGSVTFYGHVQGKGSYASGKKTFADGEEFDGRFKMGGTSTFTEEAGTCVFKFEAKKGQTIKVYAVHGSSSGDDRMLYVSSANNKDEANIIGSVATVAAAADPAVLSCTAPADGTYWVWEAGNVGVYAIVVSTPDAVEAAKADEAPAKAAPKKVLTSKGIMIGNTNVAGQRVK